MTARDLIHLADRYPVLILILFSLPILAAFILEPLHGKERGETPPWKYVYAALIYLVSVPGMFACVVTAYSLLFSGENLLDASLLSYLLPIVSMGVTLMVIRKRVDFDAIPGFDRLFGLMALIGVSFLIVLILQKTRLWLFFGGSIWTFVAFAVFAFALLKWAANMLFRGKDESAPRRPTFPGNEP